MNLDRICVGKLWATDGQTFLPLLEKMVEKLSILTVEYIILNSPLKWKNEDHYHS